MTDPIDPTLDLVEDRVRRTFTARAEDIAAGDATGAVPDFGRDGRAAVSRFRGTRRPMLAAAALVVVVGATAGVALVARGGDGAPGVQTTGAEQPPSSEAAGDAVTAPRAVVEALQAERNLAVTTLLGFEGAIEMPVSDTVQARSEADATIISFAAFVSGDPEGAAYRAGLDALAALGDLRRDIDAYAGPRTLDGARAAQDVFDRYAGMIGGLLDDQQAYALTIDDPVARAGAVAYGWGLRLDERSTQLVQVSLLAAVLPDTTSELVAELSRLHAQVQQGLDTLVAETAGTPFAGAADALVGKVEATGLLGATGSAMDGMVDVSLILDAAGTLEDEGWPAFLDRVEETLAAEGR